MPESAGPSAESAHPISQKGRRARGIAAISEAARRINASLDLRETLDAIASAAAELAPCTLIAIDLWDQERQLLVLQALHSPLEQPFAIGQTFTPGEGYTGWVVRNKRSLLVVDVDARQDIRPRLLPGERPFKAYIGVPLLAGEELIGILELVHDQAGLFDERDLELLEALAGQAAIAIHNARLYQALARRHRELAALYALASVIIQPLPLSKILDQAITKVIEVTGTDVGVIRLLDPETGDLDIAAYQGICAEDVQMLDQLNVGRGEGSHLRQRRTPIVVTNPLSDDPRFSSMSETVRDLQTFVVAPMWARDKPVGSLGVSTHQQREFSAEDLDLLAGIAGQIAVAVENDHLRREALQAERLAAIGRAATGVAHDMRSPLGGILRSAEFMARPEITPETRRKLGKAIVSLSKRLINTSQGILDYVQGEKIPLRLDPCPLPDFLDELLEVLLVDFSDQGIEVLREDGYRGMVVMDSDRMAQVVYNIAANARDAMTGGGRFTVSTHKIGGQVEIRFSDTGPGIPAQLAERVFEPFFTHGKRQGAGLGLAIARRCVEAHGGTIRLESSGAQGATFVVSLPV